MTELQQKQKRGGRTSRALRAIRDFVDRRLTARTVVVVTILLLVASWIYPPWILGSYRNVSHGCFFVFDTTRDTAMRVDFGRLFLIDVIIVAGGGLLAWAVFRDSASRRATVRLASYALFVVSLMAVVCLAAVVIGNVQHEVAKRAGVPKRFDWSTGTLVKEPNTSSLYEAIGAYLVRQRPVIIEIPGYGVVEFPTGMSSAEIAAVITKIFVAPDDLQKITLFDVRPYFTLSYDECTGFHGTVRNDLPRTVKDIGINASCYSAQGKPIYVTTFWLKQEFSPNTPVSFEHVMPVEHLPEGWRYQLQVSEARYVK